MVTGMLKLTMRQIRSSLTRFLAIAAIVALGVGFFCGLRLTKTAMVHTLDDYAEAHRMYDFRLVSTVGFDETDAEALAADARVAACEGEKSADALASVADGAAKPCRFLSLPEQIDLPGLKCGRFPQTAEECLADGLLYSEKDLGKTVVLTEENDEDTLDGFNRREFTIVGIAKSVLYINYERGGTSIGSGTLSSFVYILPEAFALEYDTSLYLRLAGRQGEVYSDEYTACIDAAEPWVTQLAESAAYGRSDRLYEEAEQTLSDARETLDEKQQELADAKQELADAKQELEDAHQTYADGVVSLADAKQEAEQELADAYQKLVDGQRTIEENEQKLADGEQELADADQELAEGDQKLADAEQDYRDGEDELEKLENPDVFVLDRSSNVGYACFESDSDIVRGVSRVFPLFFFAVAALVCITTMTRMVDEQRTQAGVLKALGYSNGAILSQYFLYAGIASVLGCVLGIAAGSYFLPKMIWHAYNIMYGFTSILYAFDWPLALVSSGAYLLCALGTTWFVVHAELQKPAAELIRPRAPKAGKRILLERLPLIWDRLPFLHKVSIRNILRFKKRMVMMMIGIGGCTALLITGFGIQDSISSVVDYQYDEITRYDAAVTFQHALSGSEREDFLAVCEKSGAEGCLFVAEKSLDASAGGTVKTTNVVCPESGSVDGFIDLHTQEKTPIPYPQDGGCIISRGLAQALRLSAGDTITLQTGDMRRTELTVEAVFENYVYNYVYLTQTTWQDVFGEAPGYEAAWVNYQTDEDAQAASAALAGAKNAAAVTLSLDFRSRVATMMQSLQYIVLVVVLGAAALAFIVLYNLTNINITEREREIATIKVLGFYDGETNRYVFRENIILTVLGALVGLPMGKLLHAYVMGQIKIDLMCFDVRVAPLSYLISAALTLVFGLLVNLALRRKIRTIDMSQALKSIE